MKNEFKKAIIFLLLWMFSTSVFAQLQTNERARWFTDARFGMFVHWGVYSGAEGFWKGEKLRNDNDYAEWIMYRNRIDREEYLTLPDRFDWDEIGMFWFDMWIHHPETVVTKKQLLQLKGLIRELQPNCIVNSRLGLSIEEDPDVDFKTLPPCV
jgi:alpha-L-fucosidase